VHAGFILIWGIISHPSIFTGISVVADNFVPIECFHSNES